MSLNRHSLRLVIVTGTLLIFGALTGILFSAKFELFTAANGGQPSIVKDTTTGYAPPNFVGVIKATTPAVVNISTTRVVRQRHGDIPTPFMDDPFFRQFFGEEFSRRFQVPRERRENSLGSGVIVDAAGYIITNNHVIAKADEIKVLLSDKREFTGKVVGTDPKTDLAVIKINADNLPTVRWADSDKLEVGEYVLAIGNPFGLNQTVTLGIVSAVGRANVGIADYEDFIQTDAAINPGNSGGPLINAQGELVGINTAIFSRSGGYMGIGFAVPSNMARTVMDSLIKGGKVTRGWLGVSIQDVTADLAKSFGLSDTKGALVSEVLPDSPAASAGLQSGDIIVRLDGKDIDGPGMLRNVVAQTKVGKTVKIELLRDKKPVVLDVKITEQPKDVAQKDGGSASGEGKNTALAGVEVRGLTPDTARQLGLAAGAGGVVIASVAPGSAAAAAGLEPEDVIAEINRQAVRSVADFKRVSAKLGKNDSVLLLVHRRGGKQFVVIKP